MSLLLNKEMVKNVFSYERKGYEVIVDDDGLSIVRNSNVTLAASAKLLLVEVESEM